MNNYAEATAFDLFKSQAQSNMEAYRNKQSTKDAFALTKAVKTLMGLSNKMSGHTLIALFGEQTGAHLWEKFVVGHNRNLLSWFNSLNEEYRFFILHEFENSPHLF